VAEGGIAAETGVIKPQVVEVALQVHSQVVRPGFVFGQVKTFGGAAAHRNDSQMPGKIGGRFRTPKPQGIALMDHDPIQFPQPVFMMDDFLLIDGQNDFVTLDSEAQRIINSQDQFTET
jgi:hypothetical protein